MPLLNTALALSACRCVAPIAAFNLHSLYSCAQVGARSQIPGLNFSGWKKMSHYQRIDGRVGDRQSLIDVFNSSKHQRLLLISTRAGNMGINLQTCVIITLHNALSLSLTIN